MWILVDFESELSDARQTLIVEQVQIHEGNCTQATGDFYSRMSVEIRGNVGRGVYVNVGGDLRISGVVEGAMILCFGNISIEGGVRGDCYIRCLGNLSIGFGETSSLITQGNLKVRDNLVGCFVVAQGKISFESNEAHVMGGETHWESELSCPNVGTDTGKVTKLFGGACPFQQFLQNIDESRLVQLENYLVPVKKDLKEIKRKRTEQIGHKIQRRRVELELISSRCEKMKERLEARIQNRLTLIGRNRDTVLKVRNELSQNCEIHLSGRPIPIHKTYMSIHVVVGDDENTTFLQRSGGF